MTATNTSGSRREGGFKQLTEEEYKRKRETEFCFHCDEKFMHAHGCKNKQLNVLLLSKETEDELESVDDDFPQETEKNEDAMTLSLNAMVGISDAKSMRLKGTVNGREIRMLIDCRATHNFVSYEVIKYLGIIMDKGRRFTVQVGVDI